MSSLNNLILATFAPHDVFNNQIDSLRRRYQTLAIIYMNILMIFLGIAIPFILRVLADDPGAYFITYCVVFLTLINFFAIRRKRLEIAAFILVLLFHSGNSIASDLLNWPLVSIVWIMSYPYLILFLTSSPKLLILNSAFCFRQLFHNASKIDEIFQTTLNEEQSKQIILLKSTSLYILSFLSAVAIVHKVLETGLWSLTKENYQKSENLTKEVITALQAKDRFISMISHEIRNPLNALKGSVDYLIQFIHNPDHLKILKSARLSGEILLNLVNNMLDAAKLKSDKMEVSYMERNVVEVIKKVFKVNSELLKEKELSIQAYIDEDLPRSLLIDSSRVMQILMNLMSNAIKFTPNGREIKVYVEWCGGSEEENRESLLRLITKKSGSKRRESPIMGSQGDILELSSIEKQTFYRNIGMVSHSKGGSKHLESTERRGFIQNDPWKILRGPITEKKANKRTGDKWYLRVQITDPGDGIAESDIARLFGMFEQAMQHTRSIHGGSGLGLWICKQLCQRMNGDITVYSEVGKGSSFVFYLPVKRSERESEEISEILSTERARKRIKAMVVDDFQSNRYLHQLLLEQEGVQVVTANDGKEALEIYQKEDDYGFILMDVDMPVMDGFTAAKEIREWEMKNKKKQVEIYFVTGEYFNEGDVLRRFKNAGGSGTGIKYLRKPLDGDTLKKLAIAYSK